MATLTHSEEIPSFTEIPLGPRGLRAVRAAQCASVWLAAHWLAITNGANLLVLGVATAIPVMMALGWGTIAGPLFASYRLICHQLPYRSFFLLGHQMAFCERDAAIYGSIALAGLLFVAVRGRLRPLPWRWYFALLLPIAVDGTTQLLGLRESNWELRLLTGSLFGVATVWLAYPHLEQFAGDVLAEARDGAEEQADVPLAQDRDPRTQD